MEIRFKGNEYIFALKLLQLGNAHGEILPKNPYSLANYTQLFCFYTSTSF